MKLGLLGGADRPAGSTAPESDYLAVNRRLRDLRIHYYSITRTDIVRDYHRVIDRASLGVLRQFERFGGNTKELKRNSAGTTMAEQAYRALQETARQAEKDSDLERAGAIRKALGTIDKRALEEWQALTTKHGMAAAPSTRAMQPPPATAASTVTVAAIPPPARDPTRFDWITAYRQLCDLTDQFLEVPWVLEHADFRAATRRISSVVMYRFGKLGGSAEHPLPASRVTTRAEQAYRAIQNMARRAAESDAVTRADEIRDALESINRNVIGEIEKLTTKHGALDALSILATRAMQSVQTTKVTPTMQAAQAVQPPPVTTTPSSTARALSPGAPFPTPSWADDDFAVERALLAGELPPGFDSSPFIVEADPFAEFWLAKELAAGRLPEQTIDHLTDGFRATDDGSRNSLYIENLGSVEESIERALRAAYPGRVDREWLDLMQELLGHRSDPAAPSAASATGLPQLEVKEIDRLLGTGEGALHSAPLPPLPAAGRTGAGAVAPPPAADPWRIRPPGMSGERHPVAFDPRYAPPGPGSQVVYTMAMRTPALSTGTPPGWQGAETPGFARAASGAIELPFSYREAIALQFRDDDALLEAELALQTGSAGAALGWSATRWRPVLDDLHRLHDAIVRSDSAAAAVRIDVDWRALEALARMLDDPPPSP